MIFLPAIDLKDNKCVRLQRGKKDALTVFHNNPVDQAKFFESSGCERIHLVDLDGAFGNSNINKDTILNIRKNINIPIQLGGGIKREKDFYFWFNKGIDYLIVGSLAVQDDKLIRRISESYTNKIFIALDVLKEKIMIKGWVENSNFFVKDILNIYNKSKINGYILTDISRDGMLEGLDINLINRFVSLTNKKIIVGGGLSNYADLESLKTIKTNNLEGVIAGKSFYSGNIKINKALSILNNNA